jgi:long-chain acyl-CoA synthetase
MIHNIFARTASKYSGKPAVTNEEIQVTYNDLFIKKQRVKEYFLNSLHIQENDKIAFFLPNCAEFVYVFFAAADIGAVTIPLNVHWKEKELQYYIIKCGIRTVITHTSLLSQWGQIPTQEERIKFVLMDRLILPPQNTKAGSPCKSEKHVFETPSLDTEVLYLCTSGSTGRPKIIPKTHAHLIAGANNLGKALAVTSRDRFLAVAPFFHANGFENSMLLPIIKGASIILMRQFTPRRMLHLLEREEITILIGSPFIFSSLSDIANKTYNFPTIRFCLSAGAPLPEAVRQTFFNKFGVTIREHYGTSETGPLSVQAEDSHEDGSVGKPFDNVKVKIVDEYGRELPPNEAGEILIGSNSMTKGYLNEPQMTKEAFSGGYFRTGDLGMLDPNGNIRIIGRMKKTINAAGIKIDPVEIQNVILSHPKVKDTLVTGIKNRRGLEMVKAIVVAQPNCTVNELIIFCKERLADYKIPRIIEFRDKIPTDVMGKVIWSHGEE